jgi:hypothetical protein
MTADAVSARSAKSDTGEAIAACLAELGAFRATFALFFASPDHDGVAIGRALRESLGCEVLGCNVPSGYTEQGFCQDGVTVLAFSEALVRRAVVAIESYGDVRATVAQATKRLAVALGTDLRQLDPARHVGIVFSDPVIDPEAVNEELGFAAPFLSFVGGSGGDRFCRRNERVFCNGEAAAGGVALALLEVAKPFTIVKATGFTSTEKRFRVTRVEGRVLCELDGAPAAQVYAEALGISEESLGRAQFMNHPFGLMIEGAPWVRSITRRTSSRGLEIGCALHEQTELTLLSCGNLVADTRTVLEDARTALGGRIDVAVFFDCAYRKLELEATGALPAYHELFRGFPLVGGNTFGESYLSHHNHTMIGLLFGPCAPADRER